MSPSTLVTPQQVVNLLLILRQHMEEDKGMMYNGPATVNSVTTQIQASDMTFGAVVKICENIYPPKRVALHLFGIESGW